SSGAYPSGSKRSDGKICNDGKWVDVPDQKLCDSLYGQGKSIPDSKTNGCKLVVAKATDPCDSLRAQCSNAGKICKVNPTNNVAYCETDPSKLKSAGTVVSSASECASGKATPNAAPLIQGNTGVNGWICTGGKENDIVGTASQCESNFATPTGTPGKVKCQTCKEGINVQDASGRSYYTCEGSKAVYHVCPPGQIRKDYRMAPSECIPDPKLATPAQPEEEKPVSIDPKTLDHLGEECDGTYANKDASGKYTSVPACAQLCDKGVDGKIASKPSNGKIVCDTPKLVADTPAKPEEENKDEELADGAQCGSLGYPSCSKCPMGISTEYKEQGATGTFSKCGRQSEVEKILAEDRVPDSQQTIIGTNNANDGEKSDSETVTDTVGGAATGALILGGVGCVAAIAGGFFTGGLAWALAPAACISFGAAGALAGGTIGGILGFLK
ncbi:MAG: hypothetical protein H3C36_15225, partial [Chitinophagaceae bacterium]|nr:hypothetical protein [Chitinophagaceae bacterium]